MSEEGPGPDRAIEDPLARRFRSGDAEALALVEIHIQRIVRFRGFYVPAGERDDIVQAVLGRLWETLQDANAPPTRSLLALTETIACRRCVDWLRRQRPTEPIDPELRDGAVGQDRAYLDSERIALGRRVLSELPEACRELIRLVIDEGRPYGEIAREKGRSEHALRTRMWQCLREAREIAGRLVSGGGARPGPGEET